ncbi:MAG TPA: ABC transporter permease [Polyangiales bacterium]|nr:ABC transporter permease [Polyangiales bacterium]
MNRLLAIAWKELLQLRRDRPTLSMMIVLPMMQLMLFGYAINTDVRHIPAVVFDQDHSAESRDFVARLLATGFYDLKGYVSSYGEVEQEMRAGQARVAIAIADDFSERLQAGSTGRVQLVVDGSDPMTVASATNSGTGTGMAESRELAVAQLRAKAIHLELDRVSVEPVTWYNPELRTAVYVVPGLIGVILTMTMTMLTSMAIARERERGTLEQLIVSPVRKIELIAGKIAPFIGVGYVQISLILLLGRLVFKVPLVGSLPLLYLLSAVFIAANLSLGLFFSTLAKTQQQAMQMSFFFMLPNILLSGFVFPFEAMPRPAQAISQALPLTHFMRIVRGITLKGAVLADVYGELIWLLCILGVLVALSSLRFSKKLV